VAIFLLDLFIRYSYIKNDIKCYVGEHLHYRSSTVGEFRLDIPSADASSSTPVVIKNNPLYSLQKQDTGHSAKV